MWKRIVKWLGLSLSVSVCAVAPCAELPGETKAAADAANAFAFDLYAKLSGTPGNVFFSPCSIETALAMTSAGAREKTDAEMARVLHLPADQAVRHARVESLMKEIMAPEAKGTNTLAIANALWGQKGYSYQPEFLKVTQERYGAGFNELDFGAPDEARKTINAWVEKQTQDRIKDLMPERSITPLTRLVLTNAIYFKGTWLAPFKKEATTEQPFKAADGDTKCLLMTRNGSMPYMENDVLQAVKIPYAGKGMSMVVILPAKEKGLGDVEKALTASNWMQWMGAMGRASVDLFLPKFTVNDARTLNNTLRDLGMPAAFTPEADFSGINGKARDLYISLVIHKAFVDVNEEGTEAAAATGVAVRARGMPMPEERKVFRADRPFVYAIVSETTGTILFLGSVVKP
jgi:serpin B